MGSVATTITGFDKLIEGGFIENDLVIISGGPGAGKTTFGIQYLHGGAVNFGEAAILVTLDESPSRIIRNTWRYGWDLEKLVMQGKLKIIYADPLSIISGGAGNILEECSVKDLPMYTQVERCSLDGLLDIIGENVRRIDAKRIFIDSITALRFSLNRLETRRMLLNVVRRLEAMPCTTLLSSELPFDGSEYGVEEYLGEGVIRLHMVRVGTDKVKAIEVLKMRGVKHDESLHPYSIQDDGVVVYATDSVIVDENISNNPF